MDLAVQAVDGTKVGANASLYRTYDAEGLRRLLERLEKAIGDLEAQNEAGEDAAAVHLPGELADKMSLRNRVRQAVDNLASQERPKRINLTDSDARVMKTRQGVGPGYNAQAMVSPVTREGRVTGMLVTAAEVVDEANDAALLTPMMEQAEEITGVRSQMTLADAGYFAGRHLEECCRRGQKVAMPDRSKSLDNPYHKDKFAYDEESDTYTCPRGQKLLFVGLKNRGKKARLYRVASGAVCRECPAFGFCTKDARLGRTLHIGQHDEAIRRHRAWMETEEAKQVYWLRKLLVEPVFGIIKEQLGTRRFLLRGLANVAAEWTMLPTAFNLRTLWRVWRTRTDIGWNPGWEPRPVI